MKITLRPATMADAAVLLSWKNDPVTRAMSIDGKQISAQEHAAWLSGVLASRTVRLYVAQHDGKPAGTVRAEFTEDSTELSWTVAPELRGRGLGKAIVATALRYLSGKVVARIKEDNAASISIAKHAGFSMTGAHDGLTNWTLDVEARGGCFS